MEDYIKQMQDYLNKNSSKNENKQKIFENLENNEKSQEEEHQSNMDNIDNDHLYDAFQQIMNNSNNDNNNSNTNNKIVQNYDDMPLPALKNKKNNFDDKAEISNKKNIDDIPIKGNNNLNFNELLEKELSKEQNEGNYNNINNIPTKPKFKYIPKKRVDLVSAPGNTKKYKYYSDNFKPKNRGHSVNITKKVNNNRNDDIMENNDEEIHNNSDDNENYNNNKNNQIKKKRVAPVMPENFKNSKFNRGRDILAL